MTKLLNPVVASFVPSFSAAGTAFSRWMCQRSHLAITASVLALWLGSGAGVPGQVSGEGGNITGPAPEIQALPAPQTGAEAGAGVALSREALMERLFAELADPENENWAMTEQNIWIQWSRSGSAAMDLLLERGKRAMAAGEYGVAIEHLTALIDHAPDFAEGWNARATAYYQAGQFGPAIEDVRHVLALNPRHFGAMSGLGMMLEEMDYPKEALEAYEAARAIHPHQPGVLQGIARLHKRLDGQDI